MRYLIAGLGNPGSAYNNTRHNIGFRVAERAAERLGAKIGKKKFRSLCAEAVYSDEKLLIIKPQTFMNASGEALREAKEFYRITVEQIIVIYDELDLALGNIRITRGGGSAGHNGIRSIIASLGSGEFCRVRIGIGKPSGKKEARDYVLSGFASDEKETAAEMVETAVEATLEIISAGVDSAMNRFNSRLN